MKVRFGYVAISKELKGITTSSRVTYTRYNKLTKKEKHDKLIKVTRSNIEALEAVIKHNIKKDIHFYRISSALIPLATHPDVMWRFESYFRNDFKKIGKLIREHKMRVDMHPDQFNVLNSIKNNVVENTIESLNYHHRVLDAMGLQHEKLILHIGGATNGKDSAISRFVDNYNSLPTVLKNRLIIENDDKVYTIKDVIDISKRVSPKIPIVYDFHHDRCNKVTLTRDMIRIIVDSWVNSVEPIKVHISTGREHDNDRSHSDYININDFIDLANLFKPYTDHLDIMIEAKMKDMAMFKLIDDIKENYPELKWQDTTTLIY
ncbi:UV DNA damage repair endonuclease UvsE [Haloplasma contractile]|uniref:UV DNA damage endonuclease protein n=1 Tax=Haloplasma contractile SSD-17B TaxID=1033810 RepID=U2ECZ5_9MOLU|nr:UV DNA damage repair endonuclease UvsE [Haloplasma contractile]ERJ12631.1 UV DNA damage endonuclease protein [Haloplasma contractile SSD-17B]